MRSAPKRQLSSASRRRATPLIGRDHELSLLAECLDAAAQGAGRLVLLAGEPGIGKTRLQSEFASRAHDAGWLVLSGSAYETEGMPPYLPFAEALRAYVRAVSGEELDALIGSSKADLALVLPELRERLSGPEPAAASSDLDRYQLFEHVANFFLDLSRDMESRGLVLCLDDLHWADKSTLLLLHHLARKLKGACLLVVGAYRTEEVDPSRPFFSLLADLTREHLDERLSLKPLSLEQTNELVRAAGLPLAQATIESVYQQTQGNPFYLEEVLRDLQAQDLPGDPGAADWAIPDGVRQVIGKRLLRLTPEAQRLLESSAVLGDGFQFEIAAAMTGLEEPVLIDALGLAIGAGLLQERGETCRFGHPLIQRTIYDSLTAARRRALHLRAAQAIESAYGRHLEPFLTPLAVNYRLAGARADPDRTVDCSIQAGASAEKALAHDEAHSHWQAALQLMERYSFAPAPRADLLVRLADLMEVVGFDKYPESARYFKQSIALYEEAGARVQAASARARLGLLLAAGGAFNDNNAALVYLRAAEEGLKDEPVTEAQLWLYTGLGLVAVWRADPEQGLPASSRAAELALLLGRPDRWVTNSIMCGHHLHALGRLGEGLQRMTRAGEKADEIDQTYPAFVAARWSAGRWCEFGDWRAAEALCLEEVGQRRQAEAPSRRRSLWSFLARIKAMSGDLQECRRILEDEHLKPDPETAFWLGDWEEAAASWTRTRNSGPASGNLVDQANTCLSLANLASQQGDSAAAIALASEALDIGLQGPQIVVQLKAGAELATFLALAGQTAEARINLQRCLDIFEHGEDWCALTAKVAIAEAVLALAEGRADQAQGHFDRAIEIFDVYALPWDKAEACRTWGLALGRAGRGHAQASRDGFDRALDIYQELGAAQVWTDVVLGARETGTRRPGTQAVPKHPDGLTAREAEVLRLVASGKSSREVAEELVLSVRTVERHIANVYLKTDTHGRAQITAYALQKGLA